ncbi:hypothetical protein L1049_027264 [Liquidambar formosana]|uniref:Uncharacterized protein n=1 Tax=Liquidambar formosana TaxID=63359 RepID=A0AAP0N669_LIQFO
MVQRLTYRKRHSYATKSNQNRVVKTPGGKLVYQTTKKRASGPKCPVTGKRIQGIPHLRPAEYKSGISNAGDTLRAGEVMEDWKSLESSKQLFRLRFLSVNSNRYLVIQYLPSIGTKVVWVANPQNPLNDSSGILIMAQDGNLVITDNRGISIPINSEQPAMSGNTSATLLDSGNLVLRAGEQIVWQSFNYPLDTFIPGMKLGLFDLKTGRPRNRFLTSCVSAQVAAPGPFTLGVDPIITNQLVIWQRGVPYWRSGIWNGYNFSYLPDLRLYDAFNKFNFSYFSNENESYFTFTVNDNSVFGWIEMDSFGRLTQFVSTGGGSLLPLLACDDDEVERRSKGCVTPEPSRCSSGDVFPQISGVMSEWKYLHNSSLGLSDCKEICVRNCSCNAYASARSDGTGCKFSQGQKIDFPGWEGQGEVFYIRNNTAVVSKGNNTVVEKDHPWKRRLWITIGASVLSFIILTIAPILCYLLWRCYCHGGKNRSSKIGIDEDTELLLYRAGTSVAAIDELSHAHKLELSARRKSRKSHFEGKQGGFDGCVMPKSSIQKLLRGTKYMHLITPNLIHLSLKSLG